MSFEWLYLSQFLFVLIAVFLAGYSKALKLPLPLVSLFLCLGLHGAFSRLPFADATLLAEYSYVLAFLYGPLFYLSICNLLNLKIKRSIASLIIIAPPLFAFVLISFNFDNAILMGSLLLLFQLAAILFSYKQCAKFLKMYDQARALGVLPSVSWISNALLVYLFINVILFLRALAGDANVSDDGRLMNLVVSISIAAGLGYIVYKLSEDEGWIPRLTNEEQSISSPDQEKSISEIKQLGEQLDQYFIDAKPYLDPEVSVRKLSQDLGWSLKQLSSVINQYYQCSFSEKINRERVEQAKRLMSCPEKVDSSLLDIAFESGFNSKASFNVMFKRYTNQTPSSFRKNVSL